MVQYEILYGKPPYTSILIGVMISFIMVLFIGLILLELTGLTILTLTILITGLSIDGVIALGLLILRWRNLKRINIIKDLILEISSNGVTFTKPVNYAIGYIVSTGKWVSTGRSSYYKYSLEFNIIESRTGSHIDFKPGFLENYSILTHLSGDGYIKLPAIRIDEPELDKAFIVLIPVVREYTGNNISLNIMHSSGDYGYLELRVDKDVLKGVLNYAKKNKARMLRVELIGEIKDIPNYEELRISKRIIHLKQQGSININYNLNPVKPLALILTTQKITPLRITSITKNILETPMIYGYSDFNTKIKLVLDLPLRKDIIKEAEINLKPMISTKEVLG